MENLKKETLTTKKEVSKKDYWEITKELTGGNK